jgi:transcriptional regulator with GAF, ATPase, and Fis domain
LVYARALGSLSLVRPVPVDDEGVSYEATDELEGLFGSSAPMKRLFSLIEQVAPTRSTVLLEGETGTGKDLVARAVHARSESRLGPFVIFDAGAVARTLFDSELSGHVAGAFTGAVRDRCGAFESAHGGTLFLDEVGELPLDLQPKLLRVLEAHEAKRVGSNVARKASVRVVAATNRDLREEVRAGRFRADLYFRLAVVRIDVPALRERASDIAPLIERFLGGSAPSASPSVLEMLERYRWPGNVRELRNLVERAQAVGWDEALESMGLAPRVLSMQPSSQLPFKEAKSKAVDEFERGYLRELMERIGWNVSAAAREANVDRNHLTKLLHKHGLFPSDAST